MTSRETPDSESNEHGNEVPVSPFDEITDEESSFAPLRSDDRREARKEAARKRALGETARE
jgi:hypothetical protein